MHLSRPYPSPIPAGLSPFSVRLAGAVCKIAGRPVYFCDLRRAGDMPRGIVGLGQASAGSCGIRMGRQRAPAGSLSEGNQVRCPLIPVHFLFYFSFKTSSLFLLVATISSSCFRRSLPFYLVFDCRGCIHLRDHWPACVLLRTLRRTRGWGLTKERDGMT